MTNELRQLPKTQAEAKRLGASRYFNGKPCKNGHVAERSASGNCTECKRAFDVRTYRENSEHRAKAIERSRIHYENNKEHHLARCQQRREQNKERIKERQRAWYQANRVAILATRKLQRDDEKRSKEMASRKERIKRDPVFAMACRLRTQIATALSVFDKTGVSRASSAKIIGCSFAEFKQHIERQFNGGMCWENRGRWHIDHIVPLASAKTEDEVLALFDFTNLRPMWASANISKSNQVTHLI